jgi:hypothetical protein
LVSVEPQVTHRKYTGEIDRVVNQRSVLEARGVFFIGSSQYPNADFLFVPRRPLRVGVTAPQTGRIILPQGSMLIAAAEAGNLAARAFKARFDLSDFDLRAPSLRFMDPWTDQLLSYGTMFRAFEYEKQRGPHLVLLDDHPTEHRPFLCIRGIREYHEHPQHSGDDWLLYRREMSLFSIILSVWRVTIDLVQPTLMPQAGGLQVQWSAEEKM